MAKRRKYRNDPIEEALCEFRFESGKDWDLTLPGRFYERVQDVYDGKPRQQNVVEAGFQSVAQQEGPALEVRGSSAKVQFPTQDGLRLLALGPDVLSIHVLNPYPNWEDFFPRIQRAFREYVDLVEPTGVTMISIRYINRVVIEAPDGVDLDDYFEIAPHPPPDIPLTLFGFLSRIDSLYQDEPIRLATTLASVDAPKGKSAFLLDLEVTQNWTEEPLPLEGAIGHVEELRERERDAFEASITDRAREVFDGEQR